jgi:hypothetical protein
MAHVIFFTYCNEYTVLFNGRLVHQLGRPEERRALGRPRHRWENNMKIDLQEVGWGGMDWIDVAQNRYRWWVLVNVIMNIRVPCLVGLLVCLLLG